MGRRWDTVGRPYDPGPLGRVIRPAITRLVGGRFHRPVVSIVVKLIECVLHSDLSGLTSLALVHSPPTLTAMNDTLAAHLQSAYNMTVVTCNGSTTPTI